MKIRQQRALETRAKIVAAAEKLIRERGFDAVQVLDITNEAGVGKGSFYTYFKRKEDVIGAIPMMRFDAVREASEKGPDVTARLTGFLTESMAFIAETGLALCQQWIRNTVEPRKLCGQPKLDYDRGAIRGFLLDAAESGELTEETPLDELTDWIVREYYGVVFCWALTDGGFDPVAALSSFCEGMLAKTLDAYRRTDKR